MFRLRLGVVVVLALALLAGGWWLGANGADNAPTAPVRTSLPSGWKQLGLSPQQTKQIYAIRAQHQSKIAALREQIRELQAVEKQALLKVLTPAQKARLKELRNADVEETGATDKPVGGGKENGKGRGKATDR